MKENKWIYLISYLLFSAASLYGVYLFGFKKFGDLFLENWQIILPMSISIRYLWDVTRDRVTNDLVKKIYTGHYLFEAIISIGYAMALYQLGIKDSWDLFLAHWEIIVSMSLALGILVGAKERLYISFIMIASILFGLYSYISSGYTSPELMFVAVCINIFLLKFNDKRFMLIYSGYLLFLMIASQLIMIGMIESFTESMGDESQLIAAAKFALITFVIFTPASLSIAWKWTRDDINDETHTLINMLGGGSIWMASLAALALIFVSLFDDHELFNMDYVWSIRTGGLFILLALWSRFLDPVNESVVSHIKEKITRYINEIDDAPI